MGEVMLKIPGTERVWLGADLNGHIGEGLMDMVTILGSFGLECGMRNEEREKILEFVAANNLAVTNTYFKKRESRRIIYTSGDVNSQVDYVICRRSELKRVQDCKVSLGEALEKQHKIVIFTATIKTDKEQKQKDQENTMVEAK